MKRCVLVLLSFLIFGAIGSLVSCGSSAVLSDAHRIHYAEWVLKSPKITLLRRQVSGRYDGASSWDNVSAAARGYRAKRSWYGNAPGGSTQLDPRMLRAMVTLAHEGFRFEVTSIAGGSHSRNSRHYAGLAFDVGTINGQKVRYGSPDWRAFLRRCRALGATETFGPGDRGHWSHVHVAWPRR